MPLSAMNTNRPSHSQTALRARGRALTEPHPVPGQKGRQAYRFRRQYLDGFRLGTQALLERSSDLRRRPRGSSGPSGGQIGTAVVDIRRFFLDLPFSEAFSSRRDGPAAGNHPGDNDVIARPSNRVSHVRRLLTASMAGWTRRNAPVESDPRQGNGAGRLDTSSLNRARPSRPADQPTMAYSSLIFHAKSSIIIQLYKDFLNPTG